jgi:fatty-acyl-CoA synthase
VISDSPGRLATIPEILFRSVESAPETPAVSFVSKADEVETVSRRNLLRSASRAAGALCELGVRSAAPFIVALPTCLDTIATYVAALCTGSVPIFIPIARLPGKGEAYAAQINTLAGEIGAACIVLESNAADLLAPLLTVPVLRREALREGPEVKLTPHGAGAIAHLQATSGTTGTPKLAVVRHTNISANVCAIGEVIDQRADDRVISWLPLYHDMGLICVSCAFGWQVPLVLTDPANFVRNPITYWLGIISRTRGTISPAPASAYQVCARLGRYREFNGMDLSSWRVGFCGAEPVHERILTDFNSTFSQYGLPRTTVLPVYGLAEATLAVTIPRGDSRIVDRIDATMLEEKGRAIPAGRSSRRSVSVVAVGPVLEAHVLRVVDEQERALPERVVGEIEFAGPSAIDGYWGEHDQSSLKNADGYLRTGDLGYLADGHLFVTGRKKEIIIYYGRNIIPSQIEVFIEGGVNGFRPKGAAVIGIPSPERGTEEVHLLVEARVVPPENPIAIEDDIVSAITEAFDVRLTAIHWLEKGGIPRTSSGKIQRDRCRQMVVVRKSGRGRRSAHSVEERGAVRASRAPLTD